MRNLEINNEKDASVQDKMSRSKWKEFDNSNNAWKIFGVPKLNKISQLYLDKFSKNPDAIIKEEWSEIEDKCEEVSRSIGVSPSDDNPLFHWLMEVQSIPNTTRRLRKNKPFSR